MRVWPGPMSSIAQPDLRVAHVVTRMNVGGVSRHLIVLTTRLGVWNGVLLSGEPEGSEGSMLADAIASGAAALDVPGLCRRLWLPDDLRALWWLYRYFRRSRPQIVMTHMAKAGALGRVAAWLAGVPIRVHTFHGHVLQGYFGPLRNTLFTLGERGLGLITTRFIAVSPEIANDLQAMGIGRGRFTVIPYGLELESFEKGDGRSVRAELGITKDAPVVGIVGRLVPIKGVDVYLRSAAKIASTFSEVRFLVVGDGEQRQALESLAAELDLSDRVIFTGWRRDLASVYAALDVLVCSSHNEGTPLSVIEAAAAGRPTVASHVGGLPAIIADGQNGLLVPPGDPVALAEALATLIDSPETRRKLGAEARRRALEQFGLERLTELIGEMYSALIRTNPRAWRPAPS